MIHQNVYTVIVPHEKKKGLKRGIQSDKVVFVSLSKVERDAWFRSNSSRANLISADEYLSLDQIATDMLESFNLIEKLYYDHRDTNCDKKFVHSAVNDKNEIVYVTFDAKEIDLWVLLNNSELVTLRKTLGNSEKFFNQIKGKIGVLASFALEHVKSTNSKVIITVQSPLDNSPVENASSVLIDEHIVPNILTEENVSLIPIDKHTDPNSVLTRSIQQQTLELSLHNLNKAREDTISLIEALVSDGVTENDVSLVKKEIINSILNAMNSIQTLQ